MSSKQTAQLKNKPLKLLENVLKERLFQCHLKLLTMHIKEQRYDYNALYSYLRNNQENYYSEIVIYK